ncbi:MAG: FtsX-like permease family protein [Betaproteobacteria bacterium]|nr:MAG: FtsX-like permease family protein [Betaproteobacteria bacterium]TAG46002.1 MAG: FtsX-like permease family protein [Betaproteobacteria bacterium]
MISKLIWANVRDQPLQFLLAVLLCALGMASILAVLGLQHTLETHGARQAEGIDLVVGAKGSALQNTLAAVYHLDVPNGNIRLADVETLAKHPMVAQAIPISLGDSVGGARIVGAPDPFYALYNAKPEQGVLPNAPLEAAIGAAAARKLKLRIGDQFFGTHGFADSGDAHGDHAFVVTAILAPTGRVIDNLVVTPLASVWVVHAEHTDANAPAEVTFALLRLRGLAAMASLPRFINAETPMQATSPATESARLLANFDWIAVIIKSFAAALTVATALALLGALSQALEHRQTDLALLRAMGVKRAQLWWLLLGQALASVLLAALVALLLIAAGAWWLERYALPGVVVNGGYLAQLALWVTLAALALAILSTIPVIVRTLRLDIAALLSKS